MPRGDFFLTSKLFMTELRRDAVGEAVADTSGFTDGLPGPRSPLAS